MKLLSLSCFVFFCFFTLSLFCSRTSGRHSSRQNKKHELHKIRAEHITGKNYSDSQPGQSTRGWAVETKYHFEERHVQAEHIYPQDVPIVNIADFDNEDAACLLNCVSIAVLDNIRRPPSEQSSHQLPPSLYEPLQTLTKMMPHKETDTETRCICVINLII